VVPGIGAEHDFGRLARTCHCVFFDIRNRGRSDAVDPSGHVGLSVEVDDIDAVLDHVGIDRASLLGWSYVGRIAALYATRRPQRVDRLVLVCPAAPCQSLQPPPTEPDAATLARLEGLAESGLDKIDPVAFARAWRRIVVPLRMGDPDAFEHLSGDPSIWPNEWPEHMQDALARVFATFPEGFDYRSVVTGIRSPTLVIHGEADTTPLIASEEWVRAIPNARLRVLPGVGHFPQAEAPSVFFDAVNTFLQGSWPTESELRT
jgi:proline iminopeptidase